jgi:hypothetical protein
MFCVPIGALPLGGREDFFNPGFLKSERIKKRIFYERNESAIRAAERAAQRVHDRFTKEK